ncbi:MAG TPA: protoporphyrinogen oxidase [Gemmatimonadales bacterium]|nr:protoporphyrinogen oxidase [Gemmatimonadales bacterium]
MRAAVVVIGGGITGLAAAMRLAERIDPAGIVLLEAQEQLGGKIRTERTGDFVLEGGPDCFLATRPAGVELCRRLGIADQLVGTNPTLRQSFVKRAGRLHPLPEGISGLVPSRLMPLLTTGILSPAGRLRAGLELLVPAARGAGDESVAQFARRRFGAEAYDWLIEPLLSGIYAGDGDRLSLMATFPQMRETELRHGSLLKPMLTARFRDRGTTGGRAGFVTLPGGLGDLVAALATRLTRVQILTGAPVRSVREGEIGREYRVELSDGRIIDSDAVVLTAPAPASAALLESMDRELSALLRQIAVVSTATVSLAFPRSAVPAPLAGYGYVSPRVEGGPLVACSWTSNKFAGRAPADTVLLRCFLGRAGHDEIVTAGNDILLGVARDELRRVHGINAAPLLSRVVRWPGGMPQYTLGHADRLARIGSRLTGHPGLRLAGASYRGVGIPDCIASGWAAADSLAVPVEAA